ncbi:hypothetical protein [Nocardia altamirensis]|uniref:hypothetical protein n=1 Tax=Nocardia altamirensis TaxID=472158 RepID=UPI0014356620|nr:hypothetical protein [Nocardia altamirensis]
MSAVTVALLVGFVCCALILRALSEHRRAQDGSSVVMEVDQAPEWRAPEAGRLDA